MRLNLTVSYGNALSAYGSKFTPPKRAHLTHLCTSRASHFNKAMFIDRFGALVWALGRCAVILELLAHSGGKDDANSTRFATMAHLFCPHYNNQRLDMLDRYLVFKAQSKTGGVERKRRSPHVAQRTQAKNDSRRFPTKSKGARANAGPNAAPRLLTSAPAQSPHSAASARAAYLLAGTARRRAGRSQGKMKKWL